MRTGELYQRYYGHYLAEVVDVNDPDQLGRIRVQADQFADSVDQPVWASVVRPSAGDKQGVFFTPKKGDQVVLSYIAGDVREPMIVGYAHSTQKAPDTAKVSTQRHGIVTTIGSLIFDEQNGTITVKLDVAGAPEVSVTLAANGITAKCGDGSSITIATDHVEIKSADVKVKVTGAMDVS
jgi:uncharacterized protein involved in type VI secretion and phage assembly